MRKILVTGGAGFVGRHMVRHFLEQGDEVHVVDPVVPLTGGIDPAAGWPGFCPLDFKGFRFHKEDCRHWFGHAAETDFDDALHLAAIVGGRLMIEHNPLAVAEDLAIDASYWQWAVRARPARTVCFSSSAAYPVGLQREQDYVLLREDMISFQEGIGMPDMTYGWAKLTCEYLARLGFQHHGLKSVVYRPFSGYGEDQDDTYPFPSICKRALAGRNQPRLQVWGSGRQMRDFIHIDDCVRGVIATMDRFDDGSAINLSTGILTSFLDFARLAAGICGYRPEVVGMSDMPVGVFARGGDTTLQRSLGFAAEIDFASGIARAIRHYAASPPG
jgi:GDP-L-fucose synthase